MKLFSKLSGVVLILLSLSAAAAQDVSCWNGDCFKNGWTKTDNQKGTFTDYQCYRGPCDVQGWFTGGSQGLEIFTTCSGRGCFLDGWFEYPRMNPIPNRQVVCGKKEGVGHCLTEGWDAYDTGAGLNYYARCLQRDCATKGWTTVTQSGLVIQSVCKKGGCFKEGWTESP